MERQGTAAQQENYHHQPLNDQDKQFRNQLIADMMNNKILQFSQAAVDEIVREVDTKEKLETIAKQVEWAKKQLPKQVIEPGSTFVVDALYNGKLPVFSTKEKDLKEFKETIYRGLDIDKNMTTPLNMDDAIKKNLHNSSVVFDGYSYNSSILPVNNTSEPASLIKELHTIGVFNSYYPEDSASSEEKIHRLWSSKNCSSLRSFLDLYHKQDNYNYRQILIGAIRDIVNDINNSKVKKYNNRVEDSHLDLLNKLVDADIFLTSKEKSLFYKWSQKELKHLSIKINDEIIGRIFGDPNSAVGLRDFILSINKTKTVPYVSFLNRSDINGTEADRRRLAKNLVQKLGDWNIIDRDIDTLDKQFNHCLKWEMSHLHELDEAIDNVISGALLFSGLTQDQTEHLKALLSSITHEANYPKPKPATEPLPGKIVETPLTIKPLTGFEKITNPTTDIYVDQGISLGMQQQPKTISIHADNINIDSPNIKINGKQVNFGDDVYKKTAEELGFSNKTNWVQDPITIFSPEDFKPKKHILTPRLIPEEGVNTWEGLIPNNSTIYEKGWSNNDWYNKLYPIPILKKEDSQLVSEAKKAGIRIAATQVNKITKGILTSIVPGDQSGSLQQFLQSELGTAFVSMISGMALTYGMENNDTAQIMAKEFRVAGMAAGGNFIADEILEMVSRVVVDSLDRQEESEFSSEWEELFDEDILEEKWMEI